MITALMRPCGGRLAAPTHRLLACATAMRCQQPSSWPPAGARSLASAATDAVIVCDTPDQYEAAVAAAGDKLVVSYFTASWCGPCKMISPTFAELSLSHADSASFLKVDVDENEEVAADNQVSMMPTFVFSRNGGKLDEMAGADKDKLVQLVELYAAGGSPVEGVTKTVVTPGDASTYPKKGDKLTMHYTGKLKDNGKKFDSSLDRGQPFQFTIGVGQVIKGWDVGVMKMSLGEVATLDITSDFGYGANGAGGVIPPNADLLFEVQLLGIN